jgi:hypothetical protein
MSAITISRRVIMQQTGAMAIKGQTAQAGMTGYWGIAARWRFIGYVAAVSPLLVLLTLARLYPDLNQTSSDDWKSLISVADESWASGNPDRARHLYLQAEHAASWRRDWRGLVATACRFNRLDGANGPYSKPLSLLIRASTIVELERSRQGMSIVAQSLSLLGRTEAAAALRARTPADWKGDAEGVDDFALVEGCSSRITSATARH